MFSKRDFIVLSLGRVIQVALLFATFRALTALLPPQELGLYFYLLSVIGAFGLIVVGPVGMYFNRHLHSWLSQGELTSHARRFWAFAAVVSIVATALALLIPQPSNIGLISLAVGVCVLGGTSLNTFVPALNLLGKQRSFVLWNTTAQIAILLGASLATSFHPTAAVWLIALGATQTLFGLLGYFALDNLGASHTAPVSSPMQFRALLQFAAPLAAANIGVWGLNQGYRQAAEYFVGLEELAVIGLGIGLASSIFSALEVLAQQLYLPHFFSETSTSDPDRRRRAWRELWLELAPLYLSVALFTTGVAPFIIATISGDRYTDAWPYLAIGAWSELFRILGNLTNLISISELKTDKAVRPYLEGALVTLGLIALTQWIAVSILAGQLYAFMRLGWHFHHQTSFRIPWTVLGRITFTSAPFMIGLFLQTQLHARWQSTAFLVLASVLFGGVQLVFWLKARRRHISP
ncbi:MAG: hypothetical protein NDI61_08160 [Bdellovibrionaceae bacterium]|nr:hypothetical protein [Pseudobdellovibrionaceae bacterium]